jgi:geranylgeranyl diphosphate synthase, type II
MPNRPDIDQALADALSRYFDASGPSNLFEAVRYSLLAPGKRLRPRLAVACAEMIELDREVVLPVAVALEMLHCFTLIRKKSDDALAILSGDALLPLALDVFSEIAGNVPGKVKDAYFIQALHRLIMSTGPRGIIGGQASELMLTTRSTLDELRKTHAKKTGALFSAALLIPKDLMGISDDSSEGLSIDMFAQELGQAYQVLDDLEDFEQKSVNEKTTEITPNHILFYLPQKEARNMTLQRLNNATLSLSSNWGVKARPLLQIAEEIQKKLEIPDQD